jgi:uncharacterized protein (TIGR04222 family)
MKNTISAPTDDLCRKILDFEIDEGTPELSFRDRLARENGWTKGYAQRVIDEYLRFVCLAMVSGHVVTPSDQVDQAWHLHLTYTRSYWDRLCGEVLKRPLHHGPTRGGTAESVKYHDQYARTIESYAKLFGQSPPADIWPPSEIRFGSDLSHVRVNTSRHWVIPKPRSLQVPSFFKLALGTCLLVGVSANLGGTNQHQANFSEFNFQSIGDGVIRSLKGQAPAHEQLIFFEVLLFVISFVIFLLLEIYRKSIEEFASSGDIDAIDFNPQAEAESLDNVQIARLLGNERRSVEVALTELTSKGLCRVADDELLVVPVGTPGKSPDLLEEVLPDHFDEQVNDIGGNASNLSPLSKAVLQLLPIYRGVPLESLKRNEVLRDAIGAINNDLIRRKLIPEGGFVIRPLQLLVGLPILVLLTFALATLVVSGILIRNEIEPALPVAKSNSNALGNIFSPANTVSIAIEQLWSSLCSIATQNIHVLAHASSLVLLSVLLVILAKTLWSEILPDFKATRRGQVVSRLIKNHVGLCRISRTDYTSCVAIGGTKSLSSCVDLELQKLYKWFDRKNAAYALAAGAGGGCSIGGCSAIGGGGGLDIDGRGYRRGSKSDSGSNGSSDSSGTTGGCAGCGGCGGCGCGG